MLLDLYFIYLFCIFCEACMFSTSAQALLLFWRRLTTSPPEMIKIRFVTDWSSQLLRNQLLLFCWHSSSLWLAPLKSGVSLYFPPHLPMLGKQQKQRASTASTAAGGSQVLTNKHQLFFFFTPSHLCFIFVLLWLWLLGNCMFRQPWQLKKKKKRKICVQVHMFLLVFYCLLPAWLSMCKQFCQGHLTWQIQGSRSWCLIPY